jgi:hypothetical protein
MNSYHETFKRILTRIKPLLRDDADPNELYEIETALRSAADSMDLISGMLDEQLRMALLPDGILWTGSKGGEK